MKSPEYYSRYAVTTATRANLPHWSQQCACFVTFRLADSLPQEELAKLAEYAHEGDKRGSDIRGSDTRGSDILVAFDKEGKFPTSGRETASPVIASACDTRGSDILVAFNKEDKSPTSGRETASPETASPGAASPETASPGAASPETASPKTASSGIASPETANDDDLSILEAQEQKWLDADLGSCVLRDPLCRRIVEATLCHFQDVRYSLYAYVVMPNHVHVLFMPHEGYDIAGILKSWKGFSAREINRMTGKTGPVWQKESWDRLVRDVDQFNAYRRYIRANSRDLAFDAYDFREEEFGISTSGQETASPEIASACGIRGSDIPVAFNKD